MKIARRYAKALFEAISTTEHEAASLALNALAQKIEDSAALKSALVNPSYKISDRVAVLTELAKQAPQLQKFLALVVENGRISLISQIAKAFNDLVDAALNRVAVEITTANDLNDTEKNSVLQTVKSTQKLNGAVATWKVDREIIGGVVVKVGDSLFDGSVRGALQNMKQEFLN